MITQVKLVADNMNTAHIAMVKYFWEKEQSDFHATTDTTRKKNHIFNALHELKGVVISDPKFKAIWDSTDTSLITGKDN